MSRPAKRGHGVASLFAAYSDINRCTIADGRGRSRDPMAGLDEQLGQRCPGNVLVRYKILLMHFRPLPFNGGAWT